MAAFKRESHSDHGSACTLQATVTGAGEDLLVAGHTDTLGCGRRRGGCQGSGVATAPLSGFIKGSIHRKWPV
jgi:hypothetical protein